MPTIAHRCQALRSKSRDPRDLLGGVARLLADLKPSLVFLADPSGRVVACRVLEATTDAEAVDVLAKRLTRELAAHGHEVAIAEAATADGCRLAFAVASGARPQAVIGGWVQASDHARKRIADLAPALAVAGELARQVMENARQAVRWRRRARSVQGILRESAFKQQCAQRPAPGGPEPVPAMRPAQSHRLELMGRFAAGVAHEIHSPIQYVSNNTRFLDEAFGRLSVLLSKCLELGDAAAPPAVDCREWQDLVAAAEGADLASLIQEIPRAIRESREGIDRVAGILDRKSVV
jgi:signal transduction histidine kinase